MNGKQFQFSAFAAGRKNPIRVHEKQRISLAAYLRGLGGKEWLTLPRAEVISEYFVLGGIIDRFAGEMHGAAVFQKDGVRARLGAFQSTLVKRSVCAVEQIGIANEKVRNPCFRRKTPQHGQLAGGFVNMGEIRRALGTFRPETVQFGACGTDCFDGVFLADHPRFVSARIDLVHDDAFVFAVDMIRRKIVYILVVVGHKTAVIVVKLSNIIVGRLSADKEENHCGSGEYEKNGSQPFPYGRGLLRDFGGSFSSACVSSRFGS